MVSPEVRPEHHRSGAQIDHEHAGQNSELPANNRYNKICERRRRDSNPQAGITDQLLSRQLLHQLRDYGV